MLFKKTGVVAMFFREKVLKMPFVGALLCCFDVLMGFCCRFLDIK